MHNLHGINKTYFTKMMSKEISFHKIIDFQNRVGYTLATNWELQKAAQNKEETMT